MVYILSGHALTLHATQEIKLVGQDLKIKPFIISGEELKEKGFGGIYGVGKAAEVPPALVVLSHTPEGATQNIAWVGKGIVYDTGGLSMKTKVRHICTATINCCKMSEKK